MKPKNKNTIKVGVGVFVIKDGKILMGKRKGSHGTESWSLPGGKLDFNEELEECAFREVLEETGVNIKNIRFSTITNDMFKDENLHYITLYMMSDYDSGEPKVMEPNKCYEWKWVEWKNLPQPLFLPLQNLIKTKYNPLNG